MVFAKVLKHRWPLLISLSVFFGLYYWLTLNHNKLINVQFVIGWMLTALAVFMSSYKLRRRLSVLPLGKVEHWHLLHLYGGLWCCILFLLHAGISWPSSPINQALWFGSVLILISGILGLIITKFVTPRVSASGERLIFDRIPGHIGITREQSQSLVLSAAASTSGKPLVDYYNKHLHKIFNHSGFLGLKIFGHRKKLDHHLYELSEIKRYLDEENRTKLDQMGKLLIQKFILDWQYSTLLILRQWTLIHVPVIWFTLVILLAHIMIQYAFEIRTLW